MNSLPIYPGGSADAQVIDMLDELRGRSLLGYQVEHIDCKYDHTGEYACQPGVATMAYADQFAISVFYVGDHFFAFCTDLVWEEIVLDELASVIIKLPCHVGDTLGAVGPCSSQRQAVALLTAWLDEAYHN